MLYAEHAVRHVLHSITTLNAPTFRRVDYWLCVHAHSKVPRSSRAFQPDGELT